MSDSYWFGYWFAPDRLTCDLTDAPGEWCWQTNEQVEALISSAQLMDAVYGDRQELANRMQAAGYDAFAFLHGQEGLLARRDGADPLLVAIYQGTNVRQPSDLWRDAQHGRPKRPEWAPPGIRFAAGSVNVADPAHRQLAPRVEAFRQMYPHGRVVLIGHSLWAGGVKTLATHLAAAGRPGGVRMAADLVLPWEPPRTARKKSKAWAEELLTRMGTRVLSIRSIATSPKGDVADWVVQLMGRWLGWRHLGERVLVRRNMELETCSVATGAEAGRLWAGYKEGDGAGRWWRWGLRAGRGATAHSHKDIAKAALWLAVRPRERFS